MESSSYTLSPSPGVVLDPEPVAGVDGLPLRRHVDVEVGEVLVRTEEEVGVRGQVPSGQETLLVQQSLGVTGTQVTGEHLHLVPLYRTIIFNRRSKYILMIIIHTPDTPINQIQDPFVHHPTQIVSL